MIMKALSKPILLIGSAVLITMGLTGCSAGGLEGAAAEQQNVQKPAVRLEYWTPFSGGDNQFMTDMVSRFNEEHKDIQVVQTNSRLDDYYSRLRTAVLSGNAPDIAVIHQTSLPQFVLNGYLEDLTDSIESTGLRTDAFNPGALRTAVYDGKLFAVPMDTHALVMYYNKDFLASAGVLGPDGKPVIETGPDGFTGFLRRIQAAVPPDVAPMAQPSTRVDSVWLWWSLYNQMEGGGVFYNAESSRSAIVNPQARKALELVHGLYASKLIPPNINDAFKLFYDRKAAVLITGMWGTGAFEKAEDLRFGVVPVPVLYDKPAVWGDTHTLAIPTKHGMTEDKRKAALTFAKWIVEHGDMWAAAGHVPSVTSVVKGEAFNRLEYRSDYAAAADHVAYWPRHIKMWSMIEQLIQEFERMNYGQQSPEEALRNAAARIDAELVR